MKIKPFMDKLWKDCQIVFEGVYPRNTIHSMLLSLDASKALLARQRQIEDHQRHLHEGQQAILEAVRRIPTDSGNAQQLDAIRDSLEKTSRATERILTQFNHIKKSQHVSGQTMAAALGTGEILMELCQIKENQNDLDNGLFCVIERIRNLDRELPKTAALTSHDGGHLAVLNEIAAIRSEIDELKRLITPDATDPEAHRRQQFAEERLVEFVFPMLDDRTLIDIGAHRGQFFSEMLKVGFERVYAIEPHPRLAEELNEKYGGDSRVVVHAVAIGDAEKPMAMNIASVAGDVPVDADPLLFSTLIPHEFQCGLEFTDRIEVDCRTLASMTSEGLLPSKAGILKIDTEGYDLHVMKGMPGGAPYEVIICEFWGEEFLYSTLESPSLRNVREYMSANGYPYFIHIMRDENGQLAFTANTLPSCKKTWGNSFYFKNASLFNHAFSFMSSIMRHRL